MIKPEEFLLLHAILEKNDTTAPAYFAQWIETVEFDKVEVSSLRLLPLLYKRMALIGQPIPHLNKLKGIYRKSLYGNSLLCHKAFSVLTELEKMGVPFILLKGIALVAGGTLGRPVRCPIQPRRPPFVNVSKAGRSAQRIIPCEM